MAVIDTAYPLLPQALSRILDKCLVLNPAYDLPKPTVELRGLTQFIERFIYSGVGDQACRLPHTPARTEEVIIARATVSLSILIGQAMPMRNFKIPVSASPSA